MNIDIVYLYLYLLHNKHLLHFTGNGLKHLSKENINIVEIPIPPLNIQEQIIHKIEQLNDQSSHYNVYAQILLQHHKVMRTVHIIIIIT